VRVETHPAVVVHDVPDGNPRAPCSWPPPDPGRGFRNFTADETTLEALVVGLVREGPSARDTRDECASVPYAIHPPVLALRGCTVLSIVVRVLDVRVGRQAPDDPWRFFCRSA
jgi:hypothetical protein